MTRLCHLPASVVCSRGRQTGRMQAFPSRPLQLRPSQDTEAWRRALRRLRFYPDFSSEDMSWLHMEVPTKILATLKSVGEKTRPTGAGPLAAHRVWPARGPETHIQALVARQKMPERAALSLPASSRLLPSLGAGGPLWLVPVRSISSRVRLLSGGGGRLCPRGPGHSGPLDPVGWRR